MENHSSMMNHGDADNVIVKIILLIIIYFTDNHYLKQSITKARSL